MIKCSYIILAPDKMFTELKAIKAVTWNVLGLPTDEICGKH